MLSTNEIKQRISEAALLCNLQDELQPYSVDEITTMLLELLSLESKSFYHASTMLRDLILKSPDQSKLCDEFQAAWQKGDLDHVVRRLELGLSSDCYPVREWSTYALGKLCSSQSLDKMRDTFLKSLASDPLLLSSLVFEIKWLSDSDDELEQMLNAMVQSDSYLTRWAAVDVIQSRSTRDIEETLRTLEQDPHPFVRQAAKTINDSPTDGCTFGKAVQIFRNNMTDRRDYCLDDLKRHIEKHLQNASGSTAPD